MYFNNFASRLCLNIFLTMLAFGNTLVMANDSDLQKIEDAQGIADLKLCRDDHMGVELLCNHKWKQELEDNAVLMIISEDPAVLLTVAHAVQPVIGIDELTEERVKALGQYADGFKMKRVHVGKDEALTVEGFSEEYPEMRLLDFYIVHEYALYSVLFSVNPKEDWVDYAVLFEKIAESIKVIGSQN